MDTIKEGLSTKVAYLYSCGLLIFGVRLKLLFFQGKESKTETVPVIICEWKRINNITSTLKALDAQKNVKVKLFIWNNNRKQSKKVERLINSSKPKNSIVSIHIHNSPINVGGIGRFHIGRCIKRKVYKDNPVSPIVMIDDDQEFGKNFMSTLLKNYKEHGYGSVWAYKLLGSYWNRKQVTRNGDPADYCGTGGSIVDGTAFTSERLFLSIPSKYLFIEDLWLSFLVRRWGWRTYKIEADFQFIADDKDQYHKLVEKKEDFYCMLTKTD